VLEVAVCGVLLAECVCSVLIAAFYTYKDIPGENLWGDIVHDEELLASEKVLHYGL